MLLLDVTICLYAYRPAESESAALVSAWLAPCLMGHERIAVSEPVLASVIRIATHPKVFRTPSTPSDVLAFTESLTSAPAAQRVRPGPEHWPIVADLVKEHRLRGNDVPDAVLAAHALELGATLVTLDRGFARFAPLRTVNPLNDPGGRTIEPRHRRGGA